MGDLTVGILGQPRTGTHLLAALLDVNGIPTSGEVFKVHDNQEVLRLDCIDDVKEHLRDNLNNARKDGRASVQIHRRHLSILMKRLFVPIDQVGTALFLNYIFPEDTKFVTVSRLNKVEQAISWVVSDHTGIHHYTSDQAPINSRIPYHDETILRMLRQIKRDEGWDDLNGIIPMHHLVYEEFSKSADVTQRTLAKLGSYLGHPITIFKQAQYFKITDHCKMSQESQFVKDRIDQFFSACECDDATRSRLIEQLRGIFKF